MMTPEQTRAILLAVPVVEVVEHLNHTDFRVREKTFAALWPVQNWVDLKVGKEEQVMLSAVTKYYSVPGSGARGGWIRVKLPAVDQDTLTEVVWKAWSHTAGPKMANQY
jgi:hypothetical protein